MIGQIFHRQRIRVVDLKGFLEQNDGLFSLRWHLLVETDLGNAQGCQSHRVLWIFLQNIFESKFSLDEIVEFEVTNPNCQPNIARAQRVDLDYLLEILQCLW